MEKTNNKNSGLVFASTSRVQFEDDFWRPRQKTNHRVSLMYVFRFMEADNRFAIYNQPQTGLQDMTYKMYWESEIAKWIEAASYCLMQEPDADLEKLLDDVIAKVVSVQKPDGYLNAFISILHPEDRWKHLFTCHELFNAGTLIEAGIAHYEATGKTNLYKPVCCYADLICSVFGAGQDQIHGYCGHPGIEMALIQLYQHTQKIRYLDTARFFIHERGKQPNYYEKENMLGGIERSWVKSLQRYYSQNQRNLYEYNQSHIPVRLQTEAVGHAVRATFLYTAMAELGVEDQDTALIDTCQQLFDDICERKMYITGGVGSVGAIEGFGQAYDLPNRTAYAETCAAVGMMYFCFSLAHSKHDSRYADVIERILYNVFPAAVSVDGQRFFYENVLESAGEHKRFDQITCACCPPNVLKVMATVGRYFYSHNDQEISVHQYAQSSTTLSVLGKQVTIEQETDYPWAGLIRLHLTCSEPFVFGLRLRQPGWSDRFSLSINGELLCSPLKQDGYIVITKCWQTGDILELDLPMPIKKIWSHPAVQGNIGSFALQRGPIVYCFEAIDQPDGTMNLRLAADSPVEPRWIDDQWGRWLMLECTGERMFEGPQPLPLYASDPPSYVPAHLRAIPYFLWNNRGAMGMRVWMREACPHQQNHSVYPAASAKNS
jgi:hypothetical protein